MVEPTEALRAIETALRLVVRDVLGPDEDWLSAPGAPEREKLREKQVQEDKQRDGTSVSTDLLDYTETYQLTTLIRKNWEKFQPVFRDKHRTETFFGVVEDVRNSIAHSRNLVRFERDLISGIAGQLRNQIALFRSGQSASARYYPLIESVRDNFGLSSTTNTGTFSSLAIGPRLEVDDVLTFDGTAFNARGAPVRWYLLARLRKDHIVSSQESDIAIHVADGDSVTFEYRIQESNIGEYFLIEVRIVAEGKYHRHMPSAGMTGMAFDDARTFTYEAVNPPPS